MNKFSTALLSTCFALAAGGAVAQDAMKKDDYSSKDGMKKEMTMQQCKDHMAMKQEGKKDPAMMKMDTMCTDMMKKHGTMDKDGMMNKDGTSHPDTMKK